MRFILLLVLIAGLFLAWNRFAPAGLPGAGSTGVRLPGPTAVATVDVAPRAQADQRRGEVAFEIGEAELTRVVNQEMAGRPLGRTPLGEATLEQLQVSLHGGQAEATGSARLGGASVPVSSELVPSIDPSGRLRVRVGQATLAGLPLPDGLRQNLESSLEVQLASLFNRPALRLRSVEIGDGKLRVIGTPTA